MSAPQSELGKRLAIGIQALSEAMTNKCPAGEHLARQELAAVALEVDKLALGPPDLNSNE